MTGVDKGAKCTKDDRRDRNRERRTIRIVRGKYWSGDRRKNDRKGQKYRSGDRRKIRRMTGRHMRKENDKNDDRKRKEWRRMIRMITGRDKRRERQE